MNNKLIWLIVIGAVLLFSGEKKTSSMSGLRRKRSLRGLGLSREERETLYLEEEKAEIKRRNDVRLYPWKAESWMDYYIIIVSPKLKETYGSKKRVRDRDREIMNEGLKEYERLVAEQGSKAVEISKRKMIPEKQGQMTLFGGLGTFKKYTPKERVEAIKRNYKNKQLRDFSHLVDTAARKLKDDDIRRTHDVKHAWDDFNNYYLKELRQYVLDLLVENKAHLNIPAMAASRYKRTNPVSYVSETPEIIVMAMTNPSLLSEYLPEEKVTSQTRISKPKSLEEKQEAVKALIRRLPNPVTGKKEKIIPEKQGQMTLFGGARL